jgi:hypothetical protein
MAIISVGAMDSEVLTALPAPKSMNVIVQDIDAATTTRSANGTMLRDRVAGGETAKRKIELEWVGLNASKVSAILQSIGDEFFKVQYPDTYTGTERTAVFYVGDRSAEMYSYNLHGDGILWRSLKANFVEQ